MNGETFAWLLNTSAQIIEFLMSLNTRIFIGAFFGVVLGIWLRQYSVDDSLREGILYSAGLVGSLFIGLLKMVLIPLVFTSIAVGVANLRAHQQMHRVWQITVLCFACTTTLAIALGLSAAHLFQTGQGFKNICTALKPHN